MSKLAKLLAILLLCVGPVWAGTGSRDSVAANSDYISVADAAVFSGLNAMTIAAWINPDDATFFRVLTKRDPGGAASDREFWFTTGSDDKLAANLQDVANCIASADAIGRKNNSNTITEGVWTWVVMTWDGGTSADDIDLWEDGSEVDDADAGVGGSFTTIVDCDAPLVMFALDESPSGSEGDGQMAYVHLYNRALSVEEHEHIRYCPGSIVNGLIGFWPLIDEGSGATAIIDHSTQGNDSNANLTDTSGDGPPVSYPCGGSN